MSLRAQRFKLAHVEPEVRKQAKNAILDFIRFSNYQNIAMLILMIQSKVLYLFIKPSFIISVAWDLFLNRNTDVQVKTTTETGLIESVAAKAEGEHGKRAAHGEHQVSLNKG